MDFKDYVVEGQMSIFDIGKTPYKITKPTRLIELFGGIGSQAGNSIVVNVLVAILGQLYEGHEEDYKRINDGENL